MADAIHEFCVENIERLAAERDAARAEVGVLREALTALLAATTDLEGIFPNAFWDARAAAAAVVERPDVH